MLNKAIFLALTFIFHKECKDQKSKDECIKVIMVYFMLLHIISFVTFDAQILLTISSAKNKPFIHVIVYYMTLVIEQLH